MTRDMGMAIFGAEVSKLSMTIGWSKPVMGPEGPETRAHHYIGVCFDHHVTEEVPDPRVLELTADEEVDGDVVFHAVEVDTAGKDHINGCVNDAKLEHSRNMYDVHEDVTGIVLSVGEYIKPWHLDCHRRFVIQQQLPLHEIDSGAVPHLDDDSAHIFVVLASVRGPVP